MQRILYGHRERLTSLKFINYDQLLISASSQEDHVCCWDVQTGALLHTIRVEGVRNVIGSPHHHFFIADGKPRLQRSHSPWRRTTFVGDAKHGKVSEVVGAGEAAVFTPDGCSFITTRYDNEEDLDVRDIRTAVGQLGLESEQKVLPDDLTSPDGSSFDPEVNYLFALLRRR